LIGFLNAFWQNETRDLEQFQWSMADQASLGGVGPAPFTHLRNLLAFTRLPMK
jgi:hypothetical protein